MLIQTILEISTLNSAVQRNTRYNGWATVSEKSRALFTQEDYGYFSRAHLLNLILLILIRSILNLAKHQNKSIHIQKILVKTVVLIDNQFLFVCLFINVFEGIIIGKSGSE